MAFNLTPEARARLTVTPIIAPNGVLELYSGEAVDQLNAPTETGARLVAVLKARSDGSWFGRAHQMGIHPECFGRIVDGDPVVAFDVAIDATTIMPLGDVEVRITATMGEVV